MTCVVDLHEPGVRRVLGETGIHILTRLMGMLLMALAVQFIAGGLVDLGFGVKPKVAP